MQDNSTNTQSQNIVVVNAKQECQPYTQASKRQTNNTYVYDGSLEGYLTCVFTAFERKETPVSIVSQDFGQMSFFSEDEFIDTSIPKAARVLKGLQQKLGRDEAERIKLAFLSDDPQRGIKLLKYIQIAMRKGRYAFCDHTNTIVAEYEKLWRRVSNERHSMLQFARFRELEGGIYFSKINPNANVVPVMMEHFARRFNTQPFMIYDEVHHIAGISQNGEWQLVAVDNLDLPATTNGEESYRAMWRTFYDTICNRERLNPNLRRQWMPKRLWSNICEVTDELPQQHNEPIDVNEARVV